MITRNYGWRHSSAAFADKWQCRDGIYHLTAALMEDGWMAVVSTNANGVIWAKPGLKYLSEA